MKKFSNQQECGGGTGRQVVTRGEQDEAVEGQQPSCRTSPLCKQEQNIHSHCKMTSSGLLMCIFMTSLPETDSLRIPSGSDVLQRDFCSQPSTMQINWHSSENTGTGWSATGTPLSLQMRAGSHIFCYPVKTDGQMLSGSLLLHF